jgi:molybdopterin converting factor small subunit
VTVRLLAFARARELLSDRREIELPDGARISDAWRLLLTALPGLADVRGVRFAVGGSFAEPERVLSDGEELAILPAVGGG